MTHRQAPLGKNELRSLLADENTLTSWFEEQADGAGPAEQKYVDEEASFAEQNEMKTKRGLNAIWDDHLRDEDGEEGVTINVQTDAETSVFDSSLATFRSLHDYYNMDVPDPGFRWTDYWSTRNIRFTSIRATPHSSTMFDRENIEDALNFVLAVEDDVIQTLWSDLDADGSGVVDRDEALHWYVFPAST